MDREKLARILRIEIINISFINNKICTMNSKIKRICLKYGM